ncbi:uncharacterized protein LOC115875693 [Sitophilus oryzae]|uniref:Uncharacterized protein LOC115875693 n=1 Tax=Sitophilus oryzae TaxID=7048 RepID=A0A6J2X766_SITOR|nr:uncharacterized protein LOC115875693 [Sitophilus oryzae]
MCPELAKGIPQVTEPPLTSTNADASQVLVANHSTYTQVFLQTLRVQLYGSGRSKVVRVLIDTGSQKSYILGSTATLLGYTPKQKINLLHGLFGGSQIMRQHNAYEINLRHNTNACTFEALDVICNAVSPIFDGVWLEEMSRLDVAGKLYTGRRHILPCGLVAVETLLGWTLMGKIPEGRNSVETLSALSLFVSDTSLANLWKLETLGIVDPSEQRTREESALAAKDLFLRTITVNGESRYEVRLSWLEDRPELPNNYNLARKRVDNTVNKLRKDGLFELYDRIFEEWLAENIIEVPQTNTGEAHYLPHRPVIKESSTTKIRPVFDASAKEKYKPSLNQCLEKGLNLIEEILNIFLRFRTNKIGVVSDIRKTFFQISVHETDRDYLRFLWVNKDGG